jgi:hypothetical protein
MGKRDPAGGSNLAELRLDFDGYLILLRRELEFLTSPPAPPLHLFWHVPIGIEGSPHFIGVNVTVRRLEA